MHRTLFLLSLAAIACAMGATAEAKTMHEALHGKTSAATNSFVSNATIGNEFEIETSQLALDRSKSAEVREFAQMMIDDHSKALEGLKAAMPTDIDQKLAQTRLDAAHQKKLDALKKTPAPDFNARYIAVQKSAHKEALGVYAAYAKSGDEKDLRDYARTTIPTIKEHQKHVYTLHATQEAM